MENCCNEPKSSVRHFCNLNRSEGEIAMFLTERSCEQKVRDTKPEILKRNSASKLAICKFLEISVSKCSLYKAFAIKNGSRENSARIPSPPTRRFLGMRCGLGWLAALKRAESCAFSGEKHKKPMVWNKFSRMPIFNMPHLQT